MAGASWGRGACKKYKETSFAAGENLGYQIQAVPSQRRVTEGIQLR